MTNIPCRVYGPSMSITDDRRCLVAPLPLPPPPREEGGRIGKGKEKGRNGETGHRSEDEKTRASRAHFMGYLIRSLIVQR